MLRQQSELDVLAHGESGEHRRDLERTHHATLGHRRHAEAGNVVAVVKDRTGRRRKVFRQKVEQRGLAGAVGADDGMHAVAGKAEVDAIDSEEAAELAAEAAGFQSVYGAIRHTCTLLRSGSPIGESGLGPGHAPSFDQKFPIVN